MGALRTHGVGPLDVLYLVVLGAALAQRQPAHRLTLGMALFALAVGLVDWAETRDLVSRSVETGQGHALLVGLTLPILGLWYGLAVQPADALPLYFALLAGFFFLQAVRDAVVLTLSPVELLSRGYPNLVAVYIVFSAAADAVDQFQVALVVVGFLLYLVRKWFRWGGVILARAGLQAS
jgi:hypothetical protein